MIAKELPILKETSSGLHRNSDAPMPGSQGAQASLKPRSAAVLIPLVKSNGDWHVLYIRRASNSRDRHSGQVAFPGGATEPTDTSAVHTALRETYEEIGIENARIKIIGQIDNYYTISDFCVTPVVGIVEWPANLKLQQSEVARAFLIPLDWLCDEHNFTFRARAEMDAQSAKRHPIIVYNEYDEETLWGASARMTVNFIKALNDKSILLPH